MRYRAVNGLGSARVSRAGFGVAPKRSFIIEASHSARSPVGEKPAMMRTQSLPQAAGRAAGATQSFILWLP